MFFLYDKIPRKVFLAYSGGIDSVAVLHFLQKNHDVSLIYVNHEDEASKHEMNRVSYASNMYGIQTHIFDIEPYTEKTKMSKEEYWREQRYEIFNSLFPDDLVITCHHLDDVMETWIYTSLHGKGKLIPYKTKNVIRPFLLNRKQKFIDYVNKNELAYFEDLTNKDSNYCQRNYIRNEMMHHCLKINPGLDKTLMSKYLLKGHKW